jgi:hypothetical protein
VLFTHDFDGYEYPVEQTSALLEFKNEPYLFILTDLRSTSNKSLLEVFKLNGMLVYEEMIENGNILSLAKDSANKMIIIVGHKQYWANKPPVIFANNLGYSFNQKD